jgi:hypothetical protein
VCFRHIVQNRSLLNEVYVKSINLSYNLLNIAGPAPPSTYSATGSTRSYALQDSTCAGSPAVWFLLNNQMNQVDAGCFGQTNELCAISFCASFCDNTPGCVGFMVESDDANDASTWACNVDGDTVYTVEGGGAIYGGKKIPSSHNVYLLESCKVSV